MAAGHEAQGAVASHISDLVFLLPLLDSHMPIPTLAECIWYCAPILGGTASLNKLKASLFYGEF